MGRDRRQVHEQGAPGPEAHRGAAAAEPEQGGASTRRGSWLENEQAKDTPAGFDYAVMPLPERHRRRTSCRPTAHLRGRRRDVLRRRPRARTRAAAWSTCGTCSPRRARKGFTELTKVAHRGHGRGRGPDPLARPDLARNAALTAAGADVFSYRFDTWYKKLDDECRAATNELMFRAAPPTSSCDADAEGRRRDQERLVHREVHALSSRRGAAERHAARQVPVHRRLPGRAGGALRRSSSSARTSRRSTWR